MKFAKIKTKAIKMAKKIDKPVAKLAGKVGKASGNAAAKLINKALDAASMRKIGKKYRISPFASPAAQAMKTAAARAHFAGRKVINKHIAKRAGKKVGQATTKLAHAGIYAAPVTAFVYARNKKRENENGGFNS